MDRTWTPRKALELTSKDEYRMGRTRTWQFSQAKEKIKMRWKRWKEVKCKNCEITEESRDFLSIHHCKNNARRWKNSLFFSGHLMIKQICSMNPSNNIKVDSLKYGIKFNFCRSITLYCTNKQTYTLFHIILHQ